MSTISPGKYYIVSALSIKNDNKEVQDYGNLALHLYWGWTGNGTSVNLKFLDYKDYELWEVSDLGDNIIRITSCLAGRCLDINGANLVNGTNVQIWDANSSNAQKWTAVSSGGTVTVDHVTYPTYYIKAQANQNFCLDVQNAQNESSANVELWEYLGQDNQKWAFVPWKLFHDEGIYEIRSMLNTNLCIDVPFGTKNAETQLQIYTCNHGDNQKWIFKDMYKPDNSDTGWRITNVATGLVIDAYNRNGQLKDGSVVQQFPDNGGTNQRWLLNDHGSTVIDGYDCKMVSFGVQNNNNLVIDVPFGNAITGNAIELWTSFGTDNQLWGLYPTKKSADQLFVPNNCGVSKTLGGDALYESIPWDGTNGEAKVYPRWSCPDSWLSGQNHFQFRYRICYKSAVNGYGAIPEMSKWTDITVYTDNGTAWLADGLDMSYDWEGKNTKDGYPIVNAELYFEVRCVMQSSEELLNGNAGNGHVFIPFAPTFVLHAAEVTAKGLTLDLTSNFKYGKSYFYPKLAYTIKDGKQTQIIKYPIRLPGSGYIDWFPLAGIVNGEGTITYPKEWFPGISPATKFKIQYSYGTTELTHMYDRMPDKMTGEVDITLGPGNYVPTITLTVGDEDKRTINADVSHIGTERLWIYPKYADADSEERYEIKRSVFSDDKFPIPYPFGVGFELEAMCYNDELTQWGSTWLDVPADNELLSKYTPCHAWSAIDSDGLVSECLLCLDIRLDEAPETNGSVSLDYESYSLSGRDYQTVSFASAVKKTFTAEGVLLNKFPVLYDESVDTNYFAVSGIANRLKHALYRAPNGEICTVAVTGISYTSKPDDVTLVTGEVYHGYTSVSVSMIRESF